MDEGVDAEAGRDRAECRRALQRIAFGRDTDDDARREALAALERMDLESSPAVEKAPAPPPVAEGSDGDPRPEETSTDESVVPSAQPTDRRRRRGMLVGLFAAAAVAVLGAAIIASGGAVSSAEPGDAFDRPQSASDREVPDWLRSAFDFAEASTDEDGLADRLLDSVRREEGSDGLVGYLFRDRASDTYCLAGEQGYDCAGPGQYDLNGLRVTLIDPRAPSRYALRFEMNADEGFSARTLELDRPATLQTMDERIWPSLIKRCLAARGFPATANSDGGLVPSAVSPERKLELAMAILHCKSRFPLVGDYLAVARR